MASHPIEGESSTRGRGRSSMEGGKHRENEEMVSHSRESTEIEIDSEREREREYEAPVPRHRERTGTMAWLERQREAWIGSWKERWAGMERERWKEWIRNRDLRERERQAEREREREREGVRERLREREKVLEKERERERERAREREREREREEREREPERQKQIKRERERKREKERLNMQHLMSEEMKYLRAKYRDFIEAMDERYDNRVRRYLSDGTVEVISVEGWHGVGRWTLAKWMEKKARESHLFNVHMFIRVPKEDCTTGKLQVRIAEKLRIELPLKKIDENVVGQAILSQKEKNDDNDGRGPYPEISLKIDEELRNQKFFLLIGDAYTQIDFDAIGLPRHNRWQNNSKFVLVSTDKLTMHQDRAIKLAADGNTTWYRNGLMLLHAEAADLANSLSTKGIDLTASTILECLFYLSLIYPLEDDWTERALRYWLAEELIQRPGEDWEVLLDMLQALSMEFLDRSLSQVPTSVDKNYLTEPIRPFIFSRSMVNYEEIEEGPDLQVYETWERISISSSHMETLLPLPDSVSVPHSDRLSTLLLVRNPKLEKLPEAFFENMPNLRVLDLSLTAISSLPASLTCLQNLRLLQLNCCRNLGPTLPASSLQALEKLEWLDLSKTPLKELPEKFFQSLHNLRFLDLSHTQISSLPISVSSMLNLDSFLLHDCENLTTLPSLVDLEKLRLLDLSGNSSLKGILNISSAKLKHLYLRGCNKLESVSELRQKFLALETLDLSHCCSFKDIIAPTTSFQDILHKLRKLVLSYNQVITDLSLRGHPTLEHISLQGLDNLEKLDLSVTKLKTFPYEVSKLQNLKSLEMLEMKHLDGIDWRKINWLPEEVNLDLCSSNGGTQCGGGAFISVGKVEFFTDLQQASPLWENGLSKFHFFISPCEERARVGKDVVGFLTMKQVLCIGSYFPSQSIPNSTALHNRHLEIKGGKDRSVQNCLHGVLPHTELITLRDNNIFTTLSDLGRATSMMKLKECKVENCQRMQHFFVGETMKSEVLKCLENMWVSNLPNVVIVCKGEFSKASFSLLKHLYIDCCPRLVHIFSSTICLPSLETLEIKFCPRVKAIFEGKEFNETSLQRLQVLLLVGLTNLVNICNGHLPWTLSKFKIRSCPKMRKLPLALPIIDGTLHPNASRLSIEGELGWWNKLQWTDDRIKNCINFQEWGPFNMDVV